MASFRKRAGVYHWRGKVPIKRPDGTIVHRSVERSTHARTLPGAREAARKIEAEFHERVGRALAEVNEHTFADAALVYMKAGRERTYLAPILERIGRLPLLEVSQQVVQELVDELKPGASPATINRHVFTPTIAVINFAAKVKMCPPPTLIRPKGHDTSPPLEIPTAAWFTAVLPLLSPSKRACVLLVTLHGLRIAEAVRRVPADVDSRSWKLRIPTTKNGEPVMLPLSAPVIEAIKAIPNWHQQKWLFGTGLRRNVARDIAKACAKAGVPTFGTHAIGRHAFATRVLEAGKSVKFLMAAGRWKTAKMPMQRYGHLEASEVQAEVNEIAAEWGETAKPATDIQLKKA